MARNNIAITFRFGTKDETIKILSLTLLFENLDDCNKQFLLFLM